MVSSVAMAVWLHWYHYSLASLSLSHVNCTDITYLLARLWNELYCVRWSVKLYSIQLLTCNIARQTDWQTGSISQVESCCEW